MHEYVNDISVTRATHGMDAHRFLDHRTFKSFAVEAFKHPLLDFLGGPVLLDPAVAHLRHQRQNQACDTFDRDAQFNGYLAGEWVYLGAKYHHFGHIMSEMVHRIVPSRALFPAERNYLLVTTGDDAGLAFENLCPCYQDVLEFCEINPQQIAILNKNTIVESLCICEQGSNFGGQPTPWYLDLLEAFSKRRLEEIHGSRGSAAKVYVSKSKIPHGGTILGERYIEGLLADEGFLIFHPQDATVSEQMDVYRKAQVLVFSEGSACHGVELLGTKMLDRTFVLVRRTETRGALARILGPRSRQFHTLLDTYLLGTIAVHPQTRIPHTEFSVSLLDPDSFMASFRNHDLARLDDFDVLAYFEVAEQDLKAYFSYHMENDLADVDAWRVGEVRLEFEKLRSRFLTGRYQVPLNFAQAPESGEKIEKQAWAAHGSKKWLEAVDRWDAFRQRFPNAGEGYALGSVALVELGRFYEADWLLRMAMEKFPDYADLYSNYAWVAHHRRDWRETVTRWDAFRSKFPDVVTGYSMGAVALCELERYTEADELIRLGLKRHPGHEELLEKYAWVAHLSGNTPEAQRRWQELKAACPNNRAALRHGGVPPS